jgi:hypothetical protein
MGSCANKKRTKQAFCQALGIRHAPLSVTFRTSVMGTTTGAVFADAILIRYKEARTVQIRAGKLE